MLRNGEFTGNFNIKAGSSGFFVLAFFVRTDQHIRENIGIGDPDLEGIAWLITALLLWIGFV